LDLFCHSFIHKLDLCHGLITEAKKIGQILQICYKGSLVTTLLHIEILEPNSKLASKLCMAYKHNVKKGGNYLPFRKEFTIEMENHTYQQK
jgi:hypothetical protein